MTDLVQVQSDLDRILTTEGILFTFDRPNLPLQEKVLRWTRLLAEFPDYIALVGVWEGKEEQSFWVPYDPENIQLACRLAIEWEQDAILINRPDDKKAVVWGNGAEPVLTLPNLREVKASEAYGMQAYSKLCIGDRNVFLAA